MYSEYKFNLDMSGQPHTVLVLVIVSTQLILLATQEERVFSLLL